MHMSTDLLEGSPFRLSSYSDDEFAEDKYDRKSLTGAITMLNDTIITWTCKQQGGVSLSTMEAEFVAASDAARELLGVPELLQE